MHADVTRDTCFTCDQDTIRLRSMVKHALTRDQTVVSQIAFAGSKALLNHVT